MSFGLVGLVNSAVDFGVFSFAYYYLGLPIIAANTLAWVVAVTGSYVLNSTITFAAESGRQLGFRRYFAFALSQVAGFLANTATVWCLVELVHIPAWAAKVVGDRGELRGQFLALALRGVPRAARRCKLIWPSLAKAERSSGC